MTANGNIVLPAPQREGGLPLMEALMKRRSSRKFSEREIDLQTLSELLWATFGFGGGGKRRTAPSSHNRQETDLYVALASGTYVYDPVENVLKLVLAEDIRALTGMQDFVPVAPLNLVYVADTSKITGKDERGTVETAYVDTGFISQNAYLFCASAGLSTVTRAMIDKQALAAKLSLRPEQVITLAQTVGYPEE
ncbi:MAG: SagB/ThcOx family dehydrogenase [Bacteroidales bacterium]|nr:SagB/ThcOx family dehydrogenase [Bacteroidales bacterium]